MAALPRPFRPPEVRLGKLGVVVRQQVHAGTVGDVVEDRRVGQNRLEELVHPIHVASNARILFGVIRCLRSNGCYGTVGLTVNLLSGNVLTCVLHSINDLETLGALLLKLCWLAARFYVAHRS